MSVAELAERLGYLRALSGVIQSAVRRNFVVRRFTVTDTMRAALNHYLETLVADEADRAEAAEVLKDMESLRAW